MFKRNDSDPKDIPRDEMIGFLGKDTQLKGAIAYKQGTIRIDGRMEGEIRTEGVLILGESAVIDAEITADTVISSGKIKGNIRATEKIHLLPKAELVGSIKTPLLVIEERARFDGLCHMAPKESVVEITTLAPVAGANKQEKIQEKIAEG